MTVDLNAQTEELVRKQLQSDTFANAAEAVEVAVWQAFGAEATPELEALLGGDFACPACGA